jgi:hypothetical protein
VRAQTEKTGFFNMDIVNQVIKCKDLDEAREIAFAAVRAMPRARPENTVKANRMIETSNSVRKLADNICRGFMLAHMGLKA